jgi:hypothetical protein
MRRRYHRALREISDKAGGLSRQLPGVQGLKPSRRLIVSMTLLHNTCSRRSATHRSLHVHRPGGRGNPIMWVLAGRQHPCEDWPTQRCRSGAFRAASPRPD